MWINCFRIRKISLKSGNRLHQQTRWRQSAILNLKKNVHIWSSGYQFQMCCHVPNFIKIGWFLVQIRQFTTYNNMAAAHYLQFSKFRICHVTFIAMLFCFLAQKQNLSEIGQSAAELRPITIFKMATIRHLEFLFIWSRHCERVPNVQLCTKFHQNRMIYRA